MPDSYLVVVGIRSFQEHSKLSPREGDTVISGDKIDNDIIRCFDQKSQVFFGIDNSQLSLYNEIYVDCPGSRVLNYLAPLGWRVVAMTALPLEEGGPAKFAWTLYKD